MIDQRLKKSKFYNNNKNIYCLYFYLYLLVFTACICMQAQELLQELEGRENGSAGMEYGGRSSSRTAGPASLSMKYLVNFKCLELLGTGLILQCVGICS